MDIITEPPRYQQDPTKILSKENKDQEMTRRTPATNDCDQDDQRDTSNPFPQVLLWLKAFESLKWSVETLNQKSGPLPFLGFALKHPFRLYFPYTAWPLSKFCKLGNTTSFAETLAPSQRRASAQAYYTVKPIMRDVQTITLYSSYFEIYADKRASMVVPVVG